VKVAALVLFAVLACYAMAPVPAHAIVGTALDVEAGTSSNVVEVDRRCGPGWHWRRGHYNRYGHWVRGHCVHNRH
jgi:hypothetical protein